MNGPSILIVRLGSMGDVIHALPAVASLKHSLPGSRLAWVLHPRWRVLLEGNPFVDEVVSFDRRSLAVCRQALRRLRDQKYDLAVDFQGLIQSAVVATMARPERLFGFHQSLLRERAAALFYSSTTLARSPHVVDRNLELAAAAGATTILHAFPLPPGLPEGELPTGRFVLANPLAGWGGKQWPLDFFSELARRLQQDCGVPLVVNGAPEAAARLAEIRHACPHVSGLAGLIDATRRATAVVGVDSGPLHLAAALARPGVAIFGPTDPERNGPYGGTMTVLRAAGVETSYKRRAESDASMRAVTVDAVIQALKTKLAAKSAGCSTS